MSEMATSEVEELTRRREEIEEQIRSLLAEGRILEATRLLTEADELLPAESKIRKVLSPPVIKKSDWRDVDRSAEFLWLKMHAAEHQGKWVALVEDKLVASSDTLKELLTQLDQLQFEQRRPLIHHLI